MEVKIETTNENKLLERKEIDAVIHFVGATPNRKDIKALICGKIGANPDLVVLRSVANEFGMKRLKVSAHSYEKVESLKKNEPKFILVRDGFMTKEEAKPKKKEKKKAAPAKKK